MPEQPQEARSAAYTPEGEPACPFCGSQIDESRSQMLREAHEQLDLLALADLDSDEFDRHLQELRRFVGVA